MYRSHIAYAGLASLLVACVPSTQQTHLDQITHRINASSHSPGEARASLRSVTLTEHLDKRKLVTAVLHQNPNLEAARAAWRAAAQRYHVQDALPDPVLSYTLAPGSIFDPDVRFGQIVQLSQTIPWVGKMGSRGDVELHKADMRAATYELARIELALEACRLFDRYYVIARSLELNEQHQEIVTQLGRAVEGQYAAGKGTLNDAIQAEQVRSHLAHEHVMLKSDHEVVRAQLNALMHRQPDAKLPPPPKTLAGDATTVSQAAGEKRALTARPELHRNQAEQKSIEASIDVAQRDYLPDFTLFASYNSMWSMPAHQFMFGVSAPVPLSVDRRAGAEAAARAELAANASRREAIVDDVRTEVFEARIRLNEARHVVKLYDERLVPLSEKQVVAVRRAFGSSEASFYEVLAAQRGLLTVQRERHQALALVHTRTAELERALGKIPGLSARGGDR